MTAYNSRFTFRGTFSFYQAWFLLLVNLGPKGMILIFVENHTRGYKLSCCCIFGLGFFSFIQIAFGHDLACKKISRNGLTKKNFNLWNFQIAISIV